MSNLDEARPLLQTDLDHARQVLARWTNQVSDLEHALEQINAVSISRDALQAEDRGSHYRAWPLEKPQVPKERKSAVASQEMQRALSDQNRTKPA